MLRDFFALALNNLKRRRLRSWLTMIGVFIGIAAVVALIGLGQGLQTAITSQLASLSADKLTIQNSGTGYGPPGSTVIEKLNEHDMKVISNIRGVDEVIPRLIRIGKVEFNGITKFKFIGSMPEDEKQIALIYESVGLKIEEGKLLKEDDKGKIVIGSNVAKKEEVGKNTEVGKRIKIQDKKFEVIGILKKSSMPMMNEVILMLEKDMKELLDIGDEIDIIIAQVDSDEIEEIAERIENALRKDRGLKLGEEDFSVETPLETISAVNTILTSVNIVVIGIALISLIVGGIGIANTMYTSVLERTKDIGTMKAIGAKNLDVLIIFLIESGLLGLVGGLIGVIVGMGIALGVAGAANSYFGAEFISVNFNLALITGAIAFAFFIGVLSGTLPSYQASKLKPVDALRG